MLRQIEVDGFKSLTNFSLNIEPGLNILVGPNGSGKSNIILFFELLHHLATGSVTHAIGRIGGAGEVFTLMGDGNLKPELSFTIRGSGYFDSRYRRQKKQRFLTYEYSATIRLAMHLGTLQFVHQQLHMAEGDDRQKSMHFAAPTPSLAFRWDADTQPAPRSMVSSLDETLFVPFYFRDDDKTFNAQEFLSRTFTEELPEYSILQLLDRFVEPVGIIARDFVEGRAYNIDPNAVRQREDIASEPGIQFDGRGLAATLFASQKMGHSQNALIRPSHHTVGHYFPRDLVEQVSRYARLVNESIESVEVVSDPFENKLRAWLIQKVRRSDIRVPLSLASDGTVKWLALTTAVLSSNSAFAIEEPENYLHPHMQTEIIHIVRNKTRGHKRMFAIFTTHSETLLNAASPREVIVVSNVDGATKAARPTNAEELASEIRSTGFGLGFFYIAGALE